MNDRLLFFIQQYGWKSFYTLEFGIVVNKKLEIEMPDICNNASKDNKEKRTDCDEDD